MIRIDRVSEESQLINIGPSHPAMHGTIRIAVEVEGEKVLASDVEMGYLHRGFEKTAENKSYPKVIPYTDRLNYCSPLINNHGFALAVEDLLKVEVPERAEILRMITDEMSRITDHLINIGALASESGALTVMLYMMQAREELWKIFELLSGARMTTSYIRIGGVKADAPRGFRPLMERALLRTREVLKEVSRLLDNNPIFLKRTKGIGALTAQEALSYGFTGPLLRANGILYDVRRFSPYSLYPRVEFEIPLGENGDVYDRYRVRMEEMEQSARIIEQGLTLLEGAPPAEIGEETVTAREALEMTKRGDSIEPERISLPPGLKGMEEERHDGILAADHPMIAPSKAQVFNSIEGLVHQFVSVMEGYGIKPPLGEVYRAVEGGNGELGFYLVSDGSDRPYRLHLRAPAFHLVSGLSRMIEGGYLADVIPTFGSINMIGGEVDR